MPRIQPLTGRKAPLLLRLLNTLTRRFLGKESLPSQIMAHNPRFLLGYLSVSFFLQSKTQLDPNLRLLAMHLVAELNGCSWCIDFGQAIGQRQGIPLEKLTSVADYEHNPIFSAAERAALAYATEATQVGARISDATFAALRQHFSEREIVELVGAVALENFYNRFNAPLEIESQGFCAIPSYAPAK